MYSINRRITAFSLMKSSVMLISLILILTGCGKAKTDANIDIKIKDQPVATSAQISPGVYTINLNSAASIDIEIITSFDDESKSKEIYRLVWNASENSLSLVALESNKSLTLEYDVDAIKNSSVTVTISDSQFPQKFSFTFSLVPVESVVVTELDVSYPQSQLVVGQSAIFLLTAKLSNGGTIQDARTIAKCVDASSENGVIEVSDDCSVKRIKEGAAEVSAELIEAQSSSPKVTNFSFSATTPIFDPVVSKLEVTYLGTSLIVGKETQLTLTGILSDNNSIMGVFDIAECVDASIDSALITVQANCKVQGMKAGFATISAKLKETQTNPPTIVSLNIEIKLPISTIDIIELLYDGQATANLLSGKKINVQVRAIWGEGTPTIITSGAVCETSPAGDFIGISNGCEITGSETLDYNITLNTDLSTITGLTNNTVIKPLLVTVSPQPIPESNIAGEYNVTIPAGISEMTFQLDNIIADTYKAKFIADGAALPDKMKMAVFTANAFCANEVAPSNKVVACGVALPIMGNISVRLINPSFNAFTSVLKLQADANILDNDNNGKRVATGALDFKKINTGLATPGHVSVNDLGDNESRYQLDNKANGLDVNATSHTVIVRFTPDSEGIQYFDDNSVRIGWILNNGAPVVECTFNGVAPSCERDSTDPAAIIIKINSPKEDLYIYVNGNGSAIFSSIVPAATADGELTYSVQVDNNF